MKFAANILTLNKVLPLNDSFDGDAEDLHPHTFVFSVKSKIAGEKQGISCKNACFGKGGKKNEFMGTNSAKPHRRRPIYVHRQGTGTDAGDYDICRHYRYCDRRVAGAHQGHCSRQQKNETA